VTVETRVPTDLVERLQEAALAAIANETPALTHRPETVKGLTIELVLRSDGALAEAIAYVERRTRAGALLGRPTGGAHPATAGSLT